MEKLSLSYKRDKVEGDYDAIIIGSGLGGMTTGAFLAKEGKKVLVLERHYEPGGFTHVFKRRGYEWDVGVHYVGDLHRATMIKKTFDYVCEEPIEWADMGEVYDKMIFGKKVYEYRKGKEEFKAKMKEYFPAPEDQKSIDDYMDLVLQTQRNQRFFFMEKALPNTMSWMMGNTMRKKALKGNTTTLEAMKTITNNKELIAVLCGQFGDYGLTPAESSFMMHAMLFKHYVNGGFYPVGGSSVIYKKIAPTILNRGGHIYTNADVQEIIVQNNKAVGVRMLNGQEIMAPIVISSAGIVNTYGHLLPKTVIEKHGLSALVKKVKPSIGHVCLYIGIDHPTKDLNLEKANCWIYPDHYDHDENIQNYLADPDNEPPLVYVSFPSAKDPDWENRYPGKTCIDIITIAPYEWWEKWDGTTKWKKRGEEYDAKKEKLAQQLLEKLYEIAPQLKGKIDYYELSTPLTTKHFVNYQYGELYGLENTPERFSQKFLRPKTPIKNLWLTGQDVVSCGVGGALASGMLTAAAITGKNMANRI
jgi:all-trans-retinol 13,14-reductase